MKNTKTLFLFICLLASAACSTRPPSSYTVSGTVLDSSFNGKTIYINHYDSQKNLDSTVIKDNKFVFTGKADSALFCRINIGKGYANFILENGQITIDLIKHNHPSGTPLNESLSRFFRLKDSLDEAGKAKRMELAKLYTTQEELGEQQINYYQNEWEPAYMAMLMAELDQNTDNDISGIILRDLSYHLTPEEMEAAIAKTEPNIRNRQTLQDLAKRVAAQIKTAEGNFFTDFTAENENGEAAALSDYVGKGKYTLVDFWASWCGPCREEIPVVAEIYEQYKNKGLQVLSVAVWDRPEATKKAIGELKINWPQMFNAELKPLEIYGFDGIPYIILFAPDGTIVARDLRGESLKAKIKELVK